MTVVSRPTIAQAMAPADGLVVLRSTWWLLRAAATLRELRNRTAEQQRRLDVIVHELWRRGVD
jgi:outer membrane protein TolC